MKILTINCVNSIYSTGKIISSIEKYTTQYGCEYLHCYEVGKQEDNNNLYRISGLIEYKINYWLSRIMGLQYGSGTMATRRLCRVIKNYHPDIVHIHCPNAGSVNLYYLIDFLKKNCFKTIITNHAEFFYTGNCAHAFDCQEYLIGCKNCNDYKNVTGSLFFNRTAEAWDLMKEAMNGFKNLTMVAVSPWAEKRMRQSVIASELDSAVIYNGIDTANTFHAHEKTALNDIYKDKTVVLHVTSNFSDETTDPKGGLFIFELARSLSNYLFVVIGPYKITKEIIPENMILVGAINNQDELAQYYSVARLTVLTSKRETFGLTCVESMCCGTPVVGFCNGGTESIAIKEYSSFVEYGDVDALCSTINEWIGKKELFGKQLEKKATTEYSDYKMAKEYYKLYKSVQGKK